MYVIIISGKANKFKDINKNVDKRIKIYFSRLFFQV